MTRSLPPLSTDQVLAFVEVARLGSLRAAAAHLHLSEEGLRSRLLSLERRLGASLYVKSRGRRGAVELSADGRRFLAKAREFLEQARTLAQVFEPGTGSSREVRVVASHYLGYYLLIDVIRAFKAAYPDIGVRLSIRTEREIAAALAEDPGLDLAVFAAVDYPAGMVYQPWFTMDWYLVAPDRHPLLAGGPVPLARISEHPLILLESGSTGRQHVLEAFYAHGITPTIAMEATTTGVIVRMVEAGLGIAVLPLPGSGVVTRGLKVGQAPLLEPVRPIDSGLFVRQGARDDPALRALVEFTLARRP